LGKQESLNKRIRETIAGKSDKELDEMERASDQHYTPFARRVLEEELSRRRMKAANHDPAWGNASDLPTPREGSAGDKQGRCYVEVWSEKNFQGEFLRIEGPNEYRALELASLSWGDSISSLRVGPAAFVLVYSEREFKGSMLTFGPNQEVINLDDLDFNDQVDSIRLVNSFKIFDGSRSEAVVNPPGMPERKRRKSTGRPKTQSEKA
jgi:hypothetical protein